MKRLEIVETESSISAQEILEVEKNMAIKLPTDYIRHLLNYNGGHPVMDTYPLLEEIIYNDGSKSNISEIAWFFAIYNGEYENFLNECRVAKYDLPHMLLPIGRGSGGDTICISIAEQTYGKIYFWLRENRAPEGEEPWWKNIYLIAESFTNFINSLYRFDLEEDDNGAEKWVSTHDRYSLPYYLSTNPQHRDLMNSFFSKTPLGVEEFIIEEMRETKDLILKYEVLEEKKRYVRIIFARTGKHRDLEEDIELE